MEKVSFSRLLIDGEEVAWWDASAQVEIRNVTDVDLLSEAWVHIRSRVLVNAQTAYAALTESPFSEGGAPLFPKLPLEMFQEAYELFNSATLGMFHKISLGERDPETVKFAASHWLTDDQLEWFESIPELVDDCFATAVQDAAALYKRQGHMIDRPSDGSAEALLAVLPVPVN